jgi:hypothetical protein
MAATAYLTVTIERFVADWFPGVVACSLVDAVGLVHVFYEKVPVVSREHLVASSVYPRVGSIAGHVVGRRRAADGRALVTVDTDLPWGVASLAGQTRFEVTEDRLSETDGPLTDG